MVKFSYYLLNQEFTLRTDHASLRWLDSFHDKATDILAQWLHYLEPFCLYMPILYRPGKLQGNADALSRIDTRPCPSEDCPNHGHLIKKVKFPSEKNPRLLHTIQTRGQDGDRHLNTDLVHLLSDEEIRVSQKLDPELWPHMRKDVENWVTCCRPCAMARRGPRRQRAPLQQELNGSPFDHVIIAYYGEW